MKHRIIKTCLLGVIAFLVVSLQAQTIWTVKNTLDAGAGSLRQAAKDARSGDVIRFDTAILTAGVDSISLSTEIDFGSRAISIIGLCTSKDTLFISGARSSRIFSFIGAGKVVLDSLVLINGNGVGSNHNCFGGAVSYFFGSDTVHVYNCTFMDNSTSCSGGAISSYTSKSSVVVMNSTFIRNNANTYGGGISSYSYSSNKNESNSFVSISNSTFTDNTARNQGGAVSSFSESNSTAPPSSPAYSYLTANNSTFDRNKAGIFGGGLSSYAGSNKAKSTSSVTINRTTFNGNTSYQNGGGLFSATSTSSSPDSSSAPVIVSNSTFSDNRAAVYGGGIYSNSSAFALETGGSIFDSSSIFNNFTNSLNSNGYNIFTDAPFGATKAGDQVNRTPNLQSLAFNGGSTKTMLPAKGSVAIDRGNPYDTSVAQNRTISGGRRDVGAAETTCVAKEGTLNDTLCYGDSMVINGTTYKAGHLSGVEVFTNVGARNCDSTVVVSLTILPEIDATIDSTAMPVLTANEAGAAYQWLDCDNSYKAIPGANSQTYAAPDNGSYAVEITVGKCSSTSSCATVRGVSIRESTFGAGFKTYPNPTSGLFSVDLGEIYPSLQLTLTDIRGKQIQSYEYKNTSLLKLRIDEPKGVYLLKIESAKEQAVIRLVKE